MKRLHKKIGVGVLVAGLLMGGVGGLGGSVAHASSGGISQEQINQDLQELSSKVKGNNEAEKVLNRAYYMGLNRNKFHLIEADKSGMINNAGKKIDKKVSLKKSDRYLEDLGSDILKHASSRSIVKFEYDELGIEFLIAFF